MTGPDDPDRDETIDTLFDAAIERAIGRLPPAYADRLGSVAIVVEDEPTEAQLASVGAPGLFGLYQGVPRTAFGADGVPVPSKITIFRGPLVRAQRGDLAAIGDAVEETILHEIAHHFGLSDARLHELRRGG
jgi:predicted Zn-dependent protease with MMP-like domain